MDNKTGHTGRTVLIFVAIIIGLLVGITYLLFYFKDHQRTCQLDVEQSRRNKQTSNPWTNSPASRRPQIECLTRTDEAYIRQDGGGTEDRGTLEFSKIERTLQNNACRMQSTKNMIGGEQPEVSEDMGTGSKQRLDVEDMSTSSSQASSPVHSLGKGRNEHVQVEYFTALTIGYQKKNLVRLPDELSDISEESLAWKDQAGIKTWCHR